MIHTNVSELVAVFEAAETAYATAVEVAYTAAEAEQPTPRCGLSQASVDQAREALSGLLTARAATYEESALRAQVLAKIVTEEVYEDLHAPLAMAVAVDLASRVDAA